jgi:hypothetical protein
MIADHAYALELDQSPNYGHYCVQFMRLMRDRCARVRKWWDERCIEVCFGRAEYGRFGDEKYLDDWPSRFDSLVHVLAQQACALAPWNASPFPIARAIFFRFHGLRIMPGRRIDLAPIHPLPAPVLEQVYRPCLHDLKAALATLSGLGFEARPQANAVEQVGAASPRCQRHL